MNKTINCQVKSDMVIWHGATNECFNKWNETTSALEKRSCNKLSSHTLFAYHNETKWELYHIIGLLWSDNLAAQSVNIKVHWRIRLLPLMPQSQPNTGPVRFWASIRFLGRKAEWGARRNFTPVLFSWSNQATGPVRLDTAVHVSRAMPVPASCGPRMGISNVFHILRDPYRAHAGPSRVPLSTLMDTYGNWQDQNLQKSRTAVECSHTGTVRTPCDPRTGCSRAVYDL